MPSGAVETRTPDPAADAGAPGADAPGASDERVLIVRDYTEDVFYRGRRPMEPIGFQPNWIDQPSKHKTYLGVTRLPLPSDLPIDPATAGQVLLGSGASGPAGPAEGWTLESLASMLRLSCGLLQRRLRISWNQDIDVRMHYQDALWSRGAASGGGMYPLEVYWVAGPSGPLTPGLYHYSTAHHALERLATGNLTDRVRAALGDTPGAEADQFLMVAVRFWKNSYKYNSFCYHVVTQDAGALLGSWEMLARAAGRPMRRMLWFSDQRLNDLLGEDGLDESVLAVVPLPWAPASASPAPIPPASASPAPVSPIEPRPLPGPAAPRPRRPHFERSATVLRFDQVERVHRATLVDGDPRPAPTAASAITTPVAATGAPISLPRVAPGALSTPIGEVMRVRRSSFGAFTARPPIRLDELAAVLAGTVAGQRYASDVKPDAASLTRLYVLANRVDGLPSGSYGYDPDAHALSPIEARPLDVFLQRSYYLTNYNMEQVGAVLAISANLDSALAQYGSRGYRVCNAEVGAVAQTAYLAAGAAGIGCGAVLGFDNIAIDELVGLDRSDERTFLFLLLGHERTDLADFDYRLV